MDAIREKIAGRLTKYEQAKILGLRMEQLARGALPTIDVSTVHPRTVMNIARAELERNTLPYVIERRLPNGVRKQWKLQDLAKS